jgi:hypothetical protein
MKRLEDKVKDIVEVRSFSQLHDLAADPAKTLGSYRFTDITSDLMAKWLERVSQASGGVGMAIALAGFRGVGKSHFLAAIAAILTKPELRSHIADEHVRSATDGLSRKPYSIARVRRGSGKDLVDELRTAVAEAVGIDPAGVGSTVSEILHQASIRVGEQAFIILFDTADDRESRVARADGRILSETAEVGKSKGMFVGVALDDDIAGADGANSSIASSFQIDYLDQEHLFKIVDTHIFAKESGKVPLLREVYQEWRRVLPGFRWSEQRFLSLYPMHPATLEIAPLIRLYLQDFALLGFAAEAGVKILGRPANSLIGLDEMFDAVQKKLRQVTELNETFLAFDKIEQDVISQAPVGTRLPAKLILKGLFLLSLDGQGASADHLAASMMIYGGSIDVGAVLDSFASGGVATKCEGKYCLHSGAPTDSNGTLSALDAAAAETSDDDVWGVLLRQTSEKFSDVEASDAFRQAPTLCTVEWRGGLRRGEIVWRHESFDRESGCDWTIFVERRSDARIDSPKPALLWQVATLTEQERATLRRYHVLRTDLGIRAELGEGLATQMQIHSIAAERIWQRVFMHEARLTASGAEYEIVDESGSAHTLSQVLSRALTPYFDSLYPQHPVFGGSLGVRESSALVANFFGGAAAEAAETRQLVNAFAAPLGLGVASKDSVIASTREDLMHLPVVQIALGRDAGESSLSEIQQRLAAAPLGLTREAQHLVLAALVAQRQFDFVTVSGNRINHRSLDLQIVWDDIQGIAAPRHEDYSVERLLSWAILLTGNESLRSIDRGEDRRLIVESLAHWQETWQADNTLAKFDELPDEELNTAVWKVASGLKRTFGATADAIETMLQDEGSLVECLKSVAGLFNDSESEYKAKTDDLAVLNKYVLLSAGRSEMLTYVASADWTGDDVIDSLRRELLGLLIGGGVALNGKNDRITELWSEYRHLYAKQFIAKHAEVMSGSADKEAIREAVASDLWSTFNAISQISLTDGKHVKNADEALRRLRSAVCKADVGAELFRYPICSCGNGLADLYRVADLPRQLRAACEKGVAEFRSNVLRSKGRFIEAAATGSSRSRMEFLIDTFEKSPPFPSLEASDLLLFTTTCPERVGDDIRAVPVEGELLIL